MMLLKYMSKIVGISDRFSHDVVSVSWKHLDYLLVVLPTYRHAGRMNSLRTFTTHVKGEELFGSELPDADLAELEIYSASTANLMEMLMWGGQLRPDGPPVDRALLTKLKAEISTSKEAEARLMQLTEYVQWYRTSYALTMLQKIEESSRDQRS